MSRKKIGKEKSNSVMFKCLNGIETVGNKLPHPITLFAILCLVIVAISAICAAFGVSATGEILNRATNEVETQTINVISLLNGEGLVYMLRTAVSNFTGFAPLGVVLVAMFGVGVADYSGYIGTVLKRSVALSPKCLITPVIVFLGVMSNVASDAGYVILIPLGALVFVACGRHPLAGLAAAFAGVSGGFSANLLIGTLDPMLGTISTEAAHLIDPNYTVGPAANYYFLVVSTFLITIVGTLVTNYIVEPRLGKWQGSKEKAVDETVGQVTKQERKALNWANITLLLMIVGLVTALLWPNSVLRNLKETGLVDQIINGSAFMDSIVIIIAILFFIPGVVYGRVSGTFQGEKDVCNALGKSMASMGGYIALVFISAQFVNYFNFTNLGTVIALKGAAGLEATGLSGPVLMVVFILLCAFINLFMGSASAKWSIMAPVFIPMFMTVGYSPELVQVAYRIGDSSTNIISPLMAYFAMIVVFAQQYDEESGIGTIISTMLPYSMAFLIFWSVLLVAWMMLGLPLGPGVGLMLPV